MRFELVLCSIHDDMQHDDVQQADHQMHILSFHCAKFWSCAKNQNL